MSTKEIEQWLADTERRLRERGTQVERIQRDTESMDPDVVLSLESDAVIATVSVWSVLQEAELHAISTTTGEDLYLDRVRIDNHQLDGLFSPVLSLF